MLKKLVGVLIGAVIVLAVYGAYVTVKAAYQVANRPVAGYQGKTVKPVGASDTWRGHDGLWRVRT